MTKKRIIEITIAGYTFSLKNLKVHDDMSDETTCFSADLVCNGKVIAYCSNDGHGGSTNVCCVVDDPAHDLYVDAVRALSTIRDEEYEKEVNALCKQYSSVVNPFVRYWTPDHLCDVLQEKQTMRDYLIEQLIAFAKKCPLSHIWIKDNIMKAAPASDDAKMLAQGYESINEYVD